MTKVLLKLSLMLVLTTMTACPRSFVPDPVAERQAAATQQGLDTQGVPDLQGQVDLAIADRQSQATMGEIGAGATVSLIDTANEFTVTTTVSTPEGQFALKFSNNFVPTSGKIYYLEAAKGLKAGTDMSNRVGSDSARVRTLVWFKGGIWQSISAGQITLNPTSTALAIILSMRRLTPVSANRRIDPATLMGIMQGQPGTDTTPSPYSYADTNLLRDETVRTAYLLVLKALRQDRDPFRVVAFDPGDPLYDTLLDVPPTLTLAALQPDTQFVGGTVAIVGAGFSDLAADNLVEFAHVSGGPVQAKVTAVEAGGTRLLAEVPLGVVPGPVAVTLSGSKVLGPTFFPALRTGHEAVDGAGNLYVANETFGSVSSISPAGEVRTFATGLISPRNVALYAGKLYVTSAGTKRGVVAVDLLAPANPPVDFGIAGSIADPRGIAFDTAGRCYVSDATAHRLYRIDSAGSQPVDVALTGARLDRPHGLSFGPDGRLYVANQGDHTVLAFTPSSGAAAVFKEGFAAPWGLAFDSGGNLYVANNLGNSVYRWEAETGALGSFANMPSPGGIAADRGGYLYAIDNSSNNVYRITPNGESSIHASGISSPTGIAKVGDKLYVLSAAHQSLMQVDVNTTGLSTLARGFNDPFGLAYDPDRDVLYVSNLGNGTISRVDRQSGQTATVLAGLVTSRCCGVSGIAYRGGRLYLRSNEWIGSYDVTDFGAAPVWHRSVMRGNRGLARDESVSGGPIYIAGGEHRILKVVGDGASGGSKDGNNKVVVFVDQARDPDLDSPRDLTVDGAGNVWAINEGNGKLTTYRPDGSRFLAPIIGGLDAPRGINRDATTIWVANNGSKKIVGFRPSDGAMIAEFPIPDAPLNLAIRGTAMYLTTSAGVARVTSYATAPSYAVIYPALSGQKTDLEVGADGAIYIMDGTGRRIAPDLSTHSTWHQDYQSPSFVYQDGAGLFWITAADRLTRKDMGDHWYRLAGVGSWGVGPLLAGVDSQGHLYLNASNHSNMGIVNRLKVDGPQEEWTYSVATPHCCWQPNAGSFAADAEGRFYIGRYFRGNLIVVDATGKRRDLSGQSDVSFVSEGIAAEPDGSVVYQTFKSHHRVERVNATDGARTILPYGLGAADM